MGINPQLLWWRIDAPCTTEKKGRIGRRNARTFQKVYNIQKGLCFWCGILCKKSPAPTKNSATIEHLISKKWGGTDSIDNLTLACYDCNQKRGSGRLIAVVTLDNHAVFK